MIDRRAARDCADFCSRCIECLIITTFLNQAAPRRRRSRRAEAPSSSSTKTKQKSGGAALALCMFSLFVAQFNEFGCFKLQCGVRKTTLQRQRPRSRRSTQEPLQHRELKNDGSGSAANPTKQFGASPGRRTAGGPAPAGDVLPDTTSAICPVLAHPHLRPQQEWK